MKKRTLEEKYNTQKSHATIRGIKWKLTFDEWKLWWEGNGGIELRGVHGLCMARKGDTGPYSISNIECITFAQNSSDGHSNKKRNYKPSYVCGEKHGMSKLTDKQTRSIKQDTRLLKEIASEYDVSIARISQIRSKS